MLKQPLLADVIIHPAFPEADDINTADGYEALTPRILGPEESAVYTEALNFACSHGDIRNIAVTGAYGAGKSSVLRTWKECPDNEFRIMTVSLADFEMQSPPQPKVNSGTKDAPVNVPDDKKTAAEEKTIEYSILQQLLYKENKSALPYSRIERIADITSSQVAATAGHLLLILSAMLTCTLCLFPKYIQTKLSLPEMVSQFLTDVPAFRLPAAGLLLFTALFLTVKKLHHIGIFDRRVSVDKIDLLKGAISTRPSSPSLLNVYIDEIVYFFEVTGYNVVVFEDLDRHNDGVIFIKLREINQIINNTRPDTQPVRFIYAVRDGLFSTAESRTKFFDFAIPVIPVMDSENAAERFSSMFTETELGSEGFSKCLSQLSLFIPDLRVMRNIANEFRIYQNIVNGAGDITRLLSMIAYKNIFSEDYHSIDEKKGVLYSFVKESLSGKIKSDYIDAKLEEINKIQSEIDSLLDDEEKDIVEIRKSILADYISPVQKRFFKFKLPPNEIIESDDLASKENMFNKFLTLSYFSITYRNQHADVLSFSKDDINIIKEVYEKRKSVLRLKTEGYVSQQEKKIVIIRHEIKDVNNGGLDDDAIQMGASGFVTWANDNIYSDDFSPDLLKKRRPQLDFVYFLLINGYIASDYMFYRSVFMPGSLSYEDNEFIKSVSIGSPQDQTSRMPLSRIENVVNKLISLGLIMDCPAWHPDILLYLLEKDIPTLRNIMQYQIEDHNDGSLTQLVCQTFVNWTVTQRIRYVAEMTSDKDKAFRFIKRLYQMEGNNAAPELLLLQLSSSGFKWNAQTTDMKQWARYILINDGLFPDHVPEGYGQQFAENLIKTGLNVSRLELCNSEQGIKIVRMIAENQLWEYSAANLKNIFLTLCDNLNVTRELFQKEPLSAIDALGIRNMNLFVRQRINDFINDFFVMSQEYFRIPELLNNNNVSKERIVDIITKMQFFIEDISEVSNRVISNKDNETISEDNDLYSLLLKHNRIRTDWSEVYHLLTDDIYSEHMFTEWFERNHCSFVGKEISTDSFSPINMLMQRVYNSEEISDDSRKKILTNLNCTLLFLPENITLEQAALLIEYRRLAPTSGVFEKVYQVFHTENERLTPLLENLILENFSLLRTEPELVMMKDDQFDRSLAERLFSKDRLPEDICTSVLNWMWNFKPSLFSEPLFIAPRLLAKLASGFQDNRMRHAILAQCLKDGGIQHDDIEHFIHTFTDDTYLAFIDDKKYRRIGFSDELWELTCLLESTGFIRAPKLNEKNKKIRFVPHYNSVLRDE
ncbi:pcar [Erwinia mallotivora]|uniref:YobI family P-loop NTPase n=1 Tax=Erwinia mallotivora TaxID=69222 RepID=UPI0021BE3766|nr:pcar [Erwinia mallotivora]